MKKISILFIIISFSLTTYAKTVGCIGYHPRMQTFGTEANSYRIKCNDQEFGMSAPYDSLFKPEKYLTYFLEKEVKRVTNLDLVASMELVNSTFSAPAKMIHIFVKKENNSPKRYCSLAKFDGIRIGNGQGEILRDFVIKCQGIAKRESLSLVTDQEAHEYMLDQGLEKVFETTFPELSSTTKNVVIYSKDI